MRVGILALALVASGALVAADDAFKGWTPEQLKVKVAQLMKENSELKAKLAGAPAAAAAPVAAAAPAASDLKVDDFEGDTASIGGTWWAGCDDKLGTTILPNPWMAEKGGSDGKGKSGRIHGHLGANKEPWAWAALALSFPNPDLRGYSALEFWAKGDGKIHNVRLEKKSVTDYANFSATFTAPKAWTKVTIPFTDFKQPEMWGTKVEASFGDVEKIAFYPTTFEGEYDFSIDNVVLKK